MWTSSMPRRGSVNRVIGSNYANAYGPYAGRVRPAWEKKSTWDKRPVTIDTHYMYPPIRKPKPGMIVPVNRPIRVNEKTPEKDGASSVEDEELEEANIGIPGIDRIRDPHYSLKAKRLWAAAIFISVILSIYQIANCFNQFIQGRPAVSVEFVRKPTVNFPSVTFCPYNAYEDNKRLNALKAEYLEANPGKYPDMESVPYSAVYEMLGSSIPIMWNLYNFTKPHFKVSLTCANTMGDQPCGVDPHIEEIDTASGRCFKVEIRGAIQSYGPLTKMSITYTNENAKWDEYDFYSRVISHDLEEESRYFSLNRGVPLFFNLDVKLALKVTEVINLNQPNNPCASAEKVERCYDKCLEKKIRSGLHCKLPFIKWDLPPCDTVQKFNESIEATMRIFRNVTDSACKCPRKCHEFVFSVFGDFNSNSEEDGTTIQLTAFFPDNVVQVVKEYQWYNFIVLLSDIGGSLGFFMGFSVLTVIEILEYFGLKYQRKRRLRKEAEMKMKMQQQQLQQQQRPPYMLRH